MALDTLFQNILIEGCSFSTDSSLTGVTIATTSSIYISVTNNAKLYVNNCKTVLDNFYGIFLTCSASLGNDVEINGCIVHAAGGIGGMIVSSARTFVMTNCYFDHSNSINKISTGKIKVYGMGSASYGIESQLVIKNNTFIGNGLESLHVVGFSASAIYCNYFDNFDISNNIFIACGNGILLELEDDTDVVQQKKCINIKENIVRGIDNYSLCQISQLTDYSELALGIVNISNNNIYTTTQVYPIPSIRNKDTYAPIGVYANLTCRINNNNIEMTGFGNTGTVLESCIQYIGIGNCNINDNSLNYWQDEDPPDYAALIYVSNNWLEDSFSATSKPTIITNNRIFSEFFTVSDITYILVKNIKDTVITNNILENTVVATDPECYIKVYYQNAAVSQVIITDNILPTEMDNGGIIYKDYVTASNLINAYVARNKNQKFIKDINCTSFMQYGINVKPTTPESYAGAIICLRTTDFIIANSPTNLNIYQQQIILDITKPNTGDFTWNTLPEGLYYTNGEDYFGYQPKLDVSDIPKYRHQIIIPMNIPDFTKISAIKIPVYLNNTSSTNSVDISLSVSMIAGNYVDDQTLIEYIPSPAASWTSTTDTITANEEVLVNLDSDNFSSLYFNPARWTVGTELQAQQNCYMLLAMNATGDGDETDLKFAIPYVRLTLVY